MRNKFKFLCDECGAENWFPRIAFARHTRPRCSACGSSWLTPSEHSVAADRLTDEAARATIRKRNADIKEGKL